jgi:hypothetical protein
LPDGYPNATFDHLAGVGLPTVYQQLADGRTFHIKNLNHATYVSNLNQTYPNLVTNEEPESGEATWGWTKMFGIFQSVCRGVVEIFGKNNQWGHDLIRSMEGRGYDVAAPGNWEGSATCVLYCNYLDRSMTVGNGKCMVITGKLPTFPSTQNGAATMTNGEMRYWSLTGYEQQTDPGSTRPGGLVLWSVSDYEIKLDASRKYIICVSKTADRPTNATAENNVTWVDAGTQSVCGPTWRWVSVNPDWAFTKTPHENNLTWNAAGWESPNYNPNLIGQNNRTGWLEDYQPVFKYMGKTCFQNLGSPVTWTKVDGVSWGATCTAGGGGGGGGGCGVNTVNPSGSLPLVLIPLLASICALGIWSRRKQAE